MNDDLRRDMLSLLSRIVGTEPRSLEVQRLSLNLIASLLPPAAAPAVVANVALAGVAAEAADAVADRRLVYVHGICRHVAGFSDTWFTAMEPFVSGLFGAGTLGQTRLEVLWSDLVNAADADAADDAPASEVAATEASEAARSQAADEIKETLRDRADRETLGAAVRAGAFAADTPAASDLGSLVSIPGLNCIDDFSSYLTDAEVRRSILDRFTSVVGPELTAGRALDVISHSWGTVVAYEGLRQLEDEGIGGGLVRNFFTVGAALSIGPVKSRLRSANQDGRKPANVRRWINLDAQGDIVGGPLKGRPYAVDLDFVNLSPFACGSFLGLVNPSCAHGSYFADGNIAVNRDIFGLHITSP